MTEIEIGIVVVITVVVVFNVVIAMVVHALEERLEGQQRLIKAILQEVRKEIKRIPDLSDRIWNAEIDLKRHREECKMTGMKFEVVELLENRIALLERKVERK